MGDGILRWFQKPLGAAIGGAVGGSLILAAGGAAIDFATEGGLVRALGGITHESLREELWNMKRNEPEEWKKLLGEEAKHHLFSPCPKPDD